MNAPGPRDEVDHDTLVFRLTEILVKLNRGEKLDPRRLAEEFNVNLRTIQRDLNQRFAHLDLIKVDGKYAIDPFVIGKLSTKDVERFAKAAGTQGLFPSLSHAFVRQLLREGETGALLVRGHHYEDVSHRAADFELVRSAIAQRERISFEFEPPGSATAKTFSNIAPYKLLNNKGIWYLAALDRGKLKTFGFARIRRLRLEGTHFDWDGTTDTRLREDSGLWQSEQRIRVVLRATAAIAPYFQRRDLVANQAIEEVASDGALVISAQVGHANEVVPIVRYWIPHLRIIEPVDWQQVLDRELAGYIAATAT